MGCRHTVVLPVGASYGEQMSSLDSASMRNPEAEHELLLPVANCEFYDPFVATADAVSPDAAVERVRSDGVLIENLDYKEQTRLKLRLAAGRRHSREPAVERAPDEWEGLLTDVTFGGMGARTHVTIDTPDGSNMSMLKPVPNAGRPGGYALMGLDAVVEFYGLDPVRLDDADLEVPVPCRRPFDDDTPTVDYTRIRDRILEEASWGHRPDVFIAHPPWKPHLSTATGTLDSIYDQYRNGEWVSLNPKYRGRFSPRAEKSKTPRSETIS